MPFTIKNWKLTLLGLIFILLFVRLGFWQLSRAHEKKILLKSFAERTIQPPFSIEKLSQLKDLRFYQAELKGHFDNAHTILLDNKIREGKIGYEVYTPFKANGLKLPILIDRGFVSIGQSRKILPIIKPITGETTLVGMLNLPPTYVALGQITDSPPNTWPLRVEYLNLHEISQFLKYNVHSYVLNMKTTAPGSYDVKWEVVTMSPEKHQGYALQWFAFALTLLILSVALNRK